MDSSHPGKTSWHPGILLRLIPLNPPQIWGYYSRRLKDKESSAMRQHIINYWSWNTSYNILPLGHWRNKSFLIIGTICSISGLPWWVFPLQENDCLQLRKFIRAHVFVCYFFWLKVARPLKGWETEKFLAAFKKEELAGLESWGRHLVFWFWHCLAHSVLSSVSVLDVPVGHCWDLCLSYMLLCQDIWKEIY